MGPELLLKMLKCMQTIFFAFFICPSLCECKALVSSAPLPKGLVTLLQSESIFPMLPNSGNVWSCSWRSTTDPTKLPKNPQFPWSFSGTVQPLPSPYLVMLFSCLARLFWFLFNQAAFITLFSPGRPSLLCFTVLHSGFLLITSSLLLQFSPDRVLPLWFGYHTLANDVKKKIFSVYVAKLSLSYPNMVVKSVKMQIN